MHRSVRTLVVLMLFAAGLSACGDDVPPLPARVLVFLDEEVATQHAAVEQRVRTMPGVTDVMVTTKEQAYAHYQQTFANDPEMLKKLKAGQLPASLRVTVTDLSHAEAVELAIGAFDGVQDSSLGVGDGDAEAQGWVGILVRLEQNPTSAQRDAVERFIRGLPGYDALSFETPEQTRDRLRERCRDHAELAAAFERVELADIRASFRFRLKVQRVPQLAELKTLDGVTPFSFVPAELIKG